MTESKKKNQNDRTTDKMEAKTIEDRKRQIKRTK